MYKFFIAAALALASLAAKAIPSSAAPVVVTTDVGHYHHHHDRHCFNKQVVSWHHGHKVAHEEHVCH